MRTAIALATVMLPLALGCSDADSPAEPIDNAPLVNAGGRVFTASGSIPAGARFVVSSGGTRATATIASDGSFSIQTRARGAVVDLIVEADGMHPSLVRVQAGAALPSLQFVLVPRRWTINSGTYNGTTVDISLDAAFRPPCTTAGDTNCDGFYPAAQFFHVPTMRAELASAPENFFHDEVDELQQELRNNISADEQVYATYIMGGIQLGRLNILSGLRVEETHVSGKGTVQVVTPEEEARRAAWRGPLTVDEQLRRTVAEYGNPRDAEAKYRDIFPSIHFRYRFFDGDAGFCGSILSSPTLKSKP